jgi:hypothetical protein
MTNQHRATPEQWDSIERCADGSDPYSCILELRARIEALETAQQPYLFRAEEVASVVVPTVKESLTDPAGSLLERVADAIGAADDEGLTNMTWSNHSRDAILEVAAWFRAERNSPETAAALEQEVNR